MLEEKVENEKEENQRVLAGLAGFMLETFFYLDRLCERLLSHSAKRELTSMRSHGLYDQSFLLRTS